MKPNKKNFCPLFLSALMILAYTNAFGKLNTIGQQSASSSSYSGLNGQFKYTSAEFLIKASEINDTGDIKSISFFKTTGDTTVSGIDSIHVYLKETDSAISNFVTLSGYTEVYSGTIPNTVKNTWVNLLFPTHFTYSGTKNIAVLIVRKNGTKMTANYPNYAVSYSVNKEFNSAYFAGDANPWKSTPAKSTQNLSTQYRPYLQLEID